MSDAILFDRDQVEHLGDLSDRPRQLNGSKLLWVDIHEGSDIGASEVERRSASTIRLAIFSRHRVREWPSMTMAATSTGCVAARSRWASLRVVAYNRSSTR